MKEEIDVTVGGEQTEPLSEVAGTYATETDTGLTISATANLDGHTDLSYAVDDNDRFEVVDDGSGGHKLVVKANQTFDFESDGDGEGTLTLTITATASPEGNPTESSAGEITVELTIANTNEISFDAAVPTTGTMAEGDVGVKFGEDGAFAATDADTDDPARSITYSLDPDTTPDGFDITGGTLTYNGPGFDYEDADGTLEDLGWTLGGNDEPHSLALTITATADNNPNDTATHAVTIMLTDADETGFVEEDPNDPNSTVPVGSSGYNFEITENDPLYDKDATDPTVIGTIALNKEVGEKTTISYVLTTHDPAEENSDLTVNTTPFFIDEDGQILLDPANIEEKTGTSTDVAGLHQWDSTGTNPKDGNGDPIYDSYIFDYEDHVPIVAVMKVMCLTRCGSWPQ